MSRSRTGVHLVSYPRTQDTPPGTLAEAFALMLTRARDDLVWQDSALCAETDPEAFFVEKGGNVRPAKRVCMACPVRTQCAEYAIENDIRWGIWGALSPKQREDIKRGRDRSAA